MKPQANLWLETLVESDFSSDHKIFKSEYFKYFYIINIKVIKYIICFYILKPN